MGTVKTIGDSLRFKIQDTTRRPHTKTELLYMFNELLESIYQEMVNVNSNFVYGVGEITTIANTIEYTPDFTHNGFLRNGSWVSGDDIFLKQCDESDKIKFDWISSRSQPTHFYLTEDNKIGYLPVPDTEYTIIHQYWKPLVPLADYDNDNFAYNGIWNLYIGKKLLSESMTILGFNGDRSLVLAEREHDKAMQMVYNHGIRRERVSSGLFSVQGT